MFGRGKKKEERKEKELKRLEEEYGLKDLDDIDYDILHKIGESLNNATLMSFGLDSGEKVNRINQEVLMEQNFMIIRLLQEISDKLDTL